MGNVLQNAKNNVAFIGAIVAALFVAYMYMTPKVDHQKVSKSINVLHNDVGVINAQISHQHISDRVIDLPEDGMKWYLLVVYSDHNGAIDRRLASNLATEPRLQSLVAQTRGYTLSASSQMYQSKYRKHYGDVFPLLVLQREDGFVCFESRGTNLNVTGAQLASAISRKIQDCKPRPKPGPQPSPQPQPHTPNSPPNIEPEKPDGTPLFVFALPVIFALGGAGFQWYRSGKKSN